MQTFKYDALQRLTEAKETNNGNQTWREVFDYDRYGNRTTHQKYAGGSTEIPQTDETRPEIDDTRNRFKPTEGYTFDANGNVEVDFAGRRFTFNGDNKQTEVRDAQLRLVGKYFYDGDGKRVKKLTYDEYGVEKDVTAFVYSGGKLIAEYTTEAPPQNPTTRFTITDQLGSPRVILDSSGDVISRRDFLPFGEEIDPDSTYRTTARKYDQEDKVRQGFTGYQNDEETGLDFAEARMYENRHGRFTAVDPLLASGKSADPQTFNRYVYVMNNPLVMTDPTGLQAGTHYKDLGNGRWALANYAKEGYTRFKGPSRIGTGPDGTRLRITSRGWRPVDDVAAAQASRPRAQPAGSSSDPINTPLLNDLGSRGDASLKLIGLLAAAGATGGLSAVPAVGAGGVLFARTVVGEGLLAQQFVSQTAETQHQNAMMAGIEADRQYGVDQAWKQEAELVRQTGQGTVDWTPAQIQELLGEKGRVQGYEGHHINSVNGHPEQARDPNNVEFRTRTEHFDAHERNWRNPTEGPLVNRRPR